MLAVRLSIDLTLEGGEAVTDDSWIKRIFDDKQRADEEARKNRDERLADEQVYEREVDGLWQACRGQLRRAVEQFNALAADEQRLQVEEDQGATFAAARHDLPAVFVRCVFEHSKRTVSCEYRFVPQLAERDSPAEFVTYRFRVKSGRLVLQEEHAQRDVAEFGQRALKHVFSYLVTGRR